MPPEIRWAARLNHVREVSLSASADLTYWTDRLAREKLRPVPLDGRAQLLVIAADAVYAGIPFREVSLSVIVSRPDGKPGDAVFLFHAFNSVRAFAFSERLFFSTPYWFAKAEVSAAIPPRVGVSGCDGDFILRMGARTQGPEADGPGGWNGPVYLPGGSQMFMAEIAGRTQTYRWGPTDEAIIRPRGRGVLHRLLDSGFTPREWSIRLDADHAKSKTYARECFT